MYVIVFILVDFRLYSQEIQNESGTKVFPKLKLSDFSGVKSEISYLKYFSLRKEGKSGLEEIQHFGLEVWLVQIVQ